MNTRAFGAIYRLVLAQAYTKARAYAAVGLLVMSILIGLFVLDGNRFDTVGLINTVGLGLVAPVVALTIGSSVFGSMREDETLVYVWLRSASRTTIVVGAMAAAVVAVLPPTVVSMVVIASLGSGEPSVVWAVAQAFVLAGLAYTALFVLWGLVIRRAFVWGLIYIFIWEFFVARGGEGTARLSINSYPASLLSRQTGVWLPLAERSAWASGVVPIVVVVTCVALAVWRLNKMSVA